jgi:tetratricopeptide (TPR) repeat protein
LPLFERIELLWRLENLRRETADIDTWKTLAAQGERLLEHAPYLTIWMHQWIGLALARAGETEKAQQQLLRLRNLADGKASGHWSTLGADLLAGEMAFMRGDMSTAVQLMAPAIERLHDMGGGSREQKDIFQDIYMELQRRLGNVEAVMEVAQRRLRKNPNHLQSLAALAWAYQQNGQTALQHQTYQQLLSRAEHVSSAAESPAVVEARQALQALN